MKWKKSLLFICMGIAIVIAVGINIHNSFHKTEMIYKDAPKSIFDYEVSIFYPYGVFSIEEDKNSFFRLGKEELPGYYKKNGDDWRNPWMITAMVISNLLDYNAHGRQSERQLAQCIVLMEEIKGMFERYGKFPRPAYQKFPDGWVSSMDAPSVMVASRMLYEITGDEKWHDFVKDLSQYVIRDVQEDGFNIKLGKNEIWPLEYAKKDIVFDDAEFVLNGSLVGYLGVYLVAQVEQDNSLTEYLKRVEAGYQKLFPEFPYSNYTWTRYMLHPPTICQPHYVHFERTLFGALAKLTGNPIFEREFAYRTKCLEHVLHPQFKQVNDKTYFIIHRACKPHPYYIDVYPSKIVFYDESNRELASYVEGNKGHRDSMVQFKAGEFLFGEVPKGAERYTYYRADTGEAIFSGKIEEESFVTDAEFTKVCDYKLQAANDAVILEKGDIEIASGRSEKAEGTLIFNLHEVEALDENCLYGIEIENDTGDDLSCGLIIRDDKEGLGRYYTPLAPGKNLVLFNILGFQGLDSSKIKEIRRIDLRLYTNNREVNGECRAGNILVFRDLFDLREYRMTSEYEIQPQ